MEVTKNHPSYPLMVKKKNCSYWLAILMIIEKYSILFHNNTIHLKLREGFRNEAVAQNYVNGEHGCNCIS